MFSLVFMGLNIIFCKLIGAGDAGVISQIDWLYMP